MTTDPDDFVDVLDAHGIGLVAGVPCSYLAGPIEALARRSRPRYVAAANEGAALATAAGAWLSGVPAAVFAQNSGFGNLVNPLTSLLIPYRVPVLVVMSVRGRAADGDAEPQHVLMARSVAPWLDSLGIPHWPLTPGTDVAGVVDRAMTASATGTPAFVLVTKGAIGGGPTTASRAGRGLPRSAVIDVVLAAAGTSPILATTGYMSRGLFQAGDRARNLYLQGSMGHVASVALGAALCRPDERFFVLDGDGALLMHLGALSTVGTYLPPNLVHVVFDNRTYASTGHQSTPGTNVDYAGLALACGYRSAARVAEVSALRIALYATGPSFVVVDGDAREAVGARASASVGLDHVAARFRESLRPATVGSGDGI
jgi:phosphonopyruvate decarboxylase